MDSRDQQQGAARRLVEVIRKVTRMVQLAPFVYLAFYSAYMFASVLVPERIIYLADGALFNSPLVTLLFLVLSRTLKLCRWHRAACLIPSSSQVEGIIDSYLFTFTQTEIIIINLLIGLLSLIFLAVADNHFFRNNGRKGHTLRNPRLLQAQG